MSACAMTDMDTTSETVSKGEYIMITTGDHERKLTGDDIDSNWDPDGLFVYLGTDASNEPLGTLTMTLGSLIAADIKEYDVVTALLSMTDKQIGTAEELNARLFELTEGSIVDVEFGGNFIRASLGLTMTRVLSHPDDVPEDIIVIGTFTAKSK